MKIIKRLFLPILLIAGIVIFSSRLTDLSKLIYLLSQGIWYYILLAILLSLGIIYFQAAIVQSLYEIYKVKEKTRFVINLVMAMNVANFIVPSIGFSGVTLFMAHAKRKDIEPTTALTVSLLYYLFYYVAFCVILGISLIYLLLTNNLSSYQATTALIFFFVILLGISFFIATAHSVNRSVKLLTFIVSFANTPLRWLKRKSLIEQTKIDEIAKGMYHNLGYIKRNKSKIIFPIIYSFITHISAIVMLDYLFISFGYPVSPAIIFVGFSMAVLFSLISITPGGIGFVEGAMVVAFRSVNVPVEVALLVTFLYRGLTFWLQFVGGMFALRNLHIETVKEDV